MNPEPAEPCLEVDGASLYFGRHRWTPDDPLVGTVSVTNVCEHWVSFGVESHGGLRVDVGEQSISQHRTQDLEVWATEMDERSATRHGTLSISPRTGNSDTVVVQLQADVDVGYVSIHDPGSPHPSQVEPGCDLDVRAWVALHGDIEVDVDVETISVRGRDWDLSPSQNEPPLPWTLSFEDPVRAMQLGFDEPMDLGDRTNARVVIDPDISSVPTEVTELWVMENAAQLDTFDDGFRALLWEPGHLPLSRRPDLQGPIRVVSTVQPESDLSFSYDDSNNVVILDGPPAQGGDIEVHYTPACLSN